jgi:DNA excision repair protein ERCC-3
VKQIQEKSGFVIAPCGCGKTLIGLLVAVLNGGRFMILTSRYPEQWKVALDEFFRPIDAAITVVVSSAPPPGVIPDVFISTYSAFCPGNERLRFTKHLVYDTVVLDEAHCAASSANLAMIDRLHAVRWCALTATLVREDKELTKLEERIGPVMAEVERGRLVQEGYIPDVNITNIVVPYDNVAQLETHIGRQNALALHPNKIQVLLQVLRVLTAESHKIIVFCDDLFCLRWTSGIVKSSGFPCVGTISMATPMDARACIIKSFEDSRISTILFVSRTGDEALDVPSASAGIVFWNGWASRRQIVQRIGRLSRIHEKKHPVFLTLLADDSKEYEASKHRETYMRQHGFIVHTEALSASKYTIPLRTGEAYVARLKSQYNRE